jgi:cell division protein FtsB
LDGTPHIHTRAPKKKEQQQAIKLDEGPPQIAALTKQVAELKDTVHILIAQIQQLRSEVASSSKTKKQDMTLL